MEEVEKFSNLLKCLDKDCQNITFNDDDNVCLSCGSKKTERLTKEEAIKIVNDKK